MGDLIEAVADYERCFSVDNASLGEDARSRQFLSFYQREMALYTLARLDDAVANYCVDRDLHPIFKVLNSTNQVPGQCSLILIMSVTWQSYGLSGLLVMRMSWGNLI